MSSRYQACAIKVGKFTDDVASCLHRPEGSAGTPTAAGNGGGGTFSREDNSAVAAAGGGRYESRDGREGDRDPYRSSSRTDGRGDRGGRGGREGTEERDRGREGRGDRGWKNSRERVYEASDRERDRERDRDRGWEEREKERERERDREREAQRERGSQKREAWDGRSRGAYDYERGRDREADGKERERHKDRPRDPREAVSNDDVRDGRVDSGDADARERAGYAERSRSRLSEPTRSEEPYPQPQHQHQQPIAAQGGAVGKGGPARSSSRSASNGAPELQLGGGVSIQGRADKVLELLRFFRPSNGEVSGLDTGTAAGSTGGGAVAGGAAGDSSGQGVSGSGSSSPSDVAAIVSNRFSPIEAMAVVAMLVEDVARQTRVADGSKAVQLLMDVSAFLQQEAREVAMAALSK